MCETRLFVGDVLTLSKEEVEDAFLPFGLLKEVWVAKDPCGFAFVEFFDRASALQAIKEMDGKVIAGKDKVKVELSKTKREIQDFKDFDKNKASRVSSSRGFFHNRPSDQSRFSRNNYPEDSGRKRYEESRPLSYRYSSPRGNSSYEDNMRRTAPPARLPYRSRSRSRERYFKRSNGESLPIHGDFITERSSETFARSYNDSPTYRDHITSRPPPPLYPEDNSISYDRRNLERSARPLPRYDSDYRGDDSIRSQPGGRHEFKRPERDYYDAPIENHPPIYSSTPTGYNRSSTRSIPSQYYDDRRNYESSYYDRYERRPIDSPPRIKRRRPDSPLLSAPEPSRRVEAAPPLLGDRGAYSPSRRYGREEFSSYDSYNTQVVPFPQAGARRLSTEMRPSRSFNESSSRPLNNSKNFEHHRSTISHSSHSLNRAYAIKEQLSENQFLLAKNASIPPISPL